jgi:hypothetical protein
MGCLPHFLFCCLLPNSRRHPRLAVMSSVIHYRFKAGAAEWSRVSFEGHALTLGELKRAIAEQRKLTPQQQSTLAGAGAGLGEAAGGGRMLQDFELVLMNVDTNEGALVDPCAR